MSDGGEYISVDQDPTPRDEEEDAFAGENSRTLRIANDLKQQDLDQRKEYADRAYGVTQTWVGFIIIVILCQIILGSLGIPKLETSEFIAVITSTTTAIVAFWLLVGTGLFKNT